MEKGGGCHGGSGDGDEGLVRGCFCTFTSSVPAHRQEKEKMRVDVEEEEGSQILDRRLLPSALGSCPCEGALTAGGPGPKADLGWPLTCRPLYMG